MVQSLLDVAKKSHQKVRSVKIHDDLVIRASLIADTKGVSTSEYLSELLRPLINRDWPKAMKGISEQIKQEEAE